ncbi:hypothetical protein [Bosea vestrisii]|uniref:Uncharacterized protein n=1 Tax=Bosea vestrisii TaxID=151416 RepID=A0ABW0H675_9HYPH
MRKDDPTITIRWIPADDHRFAAMKTARIFLGIGFALGLMMAGAVMFIAGQL